MSTLWISHPSGMAACFLSLTNRQRNFMAGAISERGKKEKGVGLPPPDSLCWHRELLNHFTEDRRCAVLQRIKLPCVEGVFPYHCVSSLLAVLCAFRCNVIPRDGEHHTSGEDGSEETLHRNKGERNRLLCITSRFRYRRHEFAHAEGFEDAFAPRNLL